MKNSFFWAKKDIVWNFRNSISENKPMFEILGNILKLILAIIFGVRIFRVFEVLGKLPYISNQSSNQNKHRIIKLPSYRVCTIPVETRTIHLCSISVK